MKNESTEKKILKKMSESLVANRSELLKVVRSDGKRDIEDAINSLVENKLIIPIYGSHTTFAITQRGIKEAR